MGARRHRPARAGSPRPRAGRGCTSCARRWARSASASARRSPTTPLLTARDVDPPAERQPLRVVFDRHARLPPDSRLAASAQPDAPVLVVCAAGGRAVAAPGVEMLPCRLVGRGAARRSAGGGSPRSCSRAARRWRPRSSTPGLIDRLTGVHGPDRAGRRAPGLFARPVDAAGAGGHLAVRPGYPDGDRASGALAAHVHRHRRRDGARRADRRNARRRPAAAWQRRRPQPTAGSAIRCRSTAAA